MARKGKPEPVDNPDVEIGASVRAKRMRFASKPETEVDFHGEAHTPEGRSDLRTSSGSERKNLPEEVEPGKVYRDVRVRWQASARLEDPGSEQEGRASGEAAKREKGSEA
jgi:hypothetical protein